MRGYILSKKQKTKRSNMKTEKTEQIPTNKEVISTMYLIMHQLQLGLSYASIRKGLKKTNLFLEPGVLPELNNILKSGLKRTSRPVYNKDGTRKVK